MQGWNCRVKLCYGILEKGRLLGFLVRLKACMSRLALHLCPYRSVRLIRWEGCRGRVEWSWKKQGDEMIEENFLGKTPSWGQLGKEALMSSRQKRLDFGSLRSSCSGMTVHEEQRRSKLFNSESIFLVTVFFICFCMLTILSQQKEGEFFFFFFLLFQWCEGKRNLRTLICFVYMD